MKLDLLDGILATLPTGWAVHRLYLGSNWTIAVVRDRAGQLRAGLAATPAPDLVAAQSKFRSGPNTAIPSEASDLAQGVQAQNPVEAAVGWATVNALLQPDPALLEDLDAIDWLVDRARGRTVALVGRFPFIDELQPVVARLWVLELSPQPGEYDASQAPQLIPQADVVAITSSTLINHTLPDILKLIQPGARVMLLGPTTPLTPVLFDFGVDLLSGVQVVDVEAVLDSVARGVTFQHMQGVRRVSLRRQ